MDQHQNNLRRNNFSMLLLFYDTPGNRNWTELAKRLKIEMFHTKVEEENLLIIIVIFKIVTLII